MFPKADPPPMVVPVSMRELDTTAAGRSRPAGGTKPLWAPDGREVFYLAPSGALMAVPVQTEPTFTAGTGVVEGGAYLLNAPRRTYDVAPDGQRFLMIKEGAEPNQIAAPPELIIVDGWFEKLKARVPVP